MIYIIFQDEIWAVNDKNQISRPGVSPSDAWVLTGACEYRYGRVAKRYTVEQVRSGLVEWRHKNGHQKSFLTDLDHGRHRVLTSLRVLWIREKI